MAFWLKLVWFSYPCISPIIILFPLRSALFNKKVILQLDYDNLNTTTTVLTKYTKNFYPELVSYCALKNIFPISIHNFFLLITNREQSNILQNNNLIILAIVWDYERIFNQNLTKTNNTSSYPFPNIFLPPCIKKQTNALSSKTGRFIFICLTQITNWTKTV